MTEAGVLKQHLAFTMCRAPWNFLLFLFKKLVLTYSDDVTVQEISDGHDGQCEERCPGERFSVFFLGRG